MGWIHLTWTGITGEVWVNKEVKCRVFKNGGKVLPSWRNIHFSGSVIFQGIDVEFRVYHCSGSNMSACLSSVPAIALDSLSDRPYFLSREGRGGGRRGACFGLWSWPFSDGLQDVWRLHSAFTPSRCHDYVQGQLFLYLTEAANLWLIVSHSELNNVNGARYYICVLKSEQTCLWYKNIRRVWKQDR